MAEDTQMETETPTESIENDTKNNTPNQIIEYLILNKDAYFKSQQRDENDLTNDEKRKIATDILTRSKANFLCRFGKQLKEEHLDYFSEYTNDAEEGYDLSFYLKNLRRYFSDSKRKMDIRNRRYAALNKLVQDNNYFSETEMMRRNPLLYDQLVGQYLSEEEKKKRDNIDTKNITFVNLLLEGIDRDALREKKKQQEQYEDDAMEEEEEEEEESSEKNEVSEEEYDSEEEPKPKSTRSKRKNIPPEKSPSTLKWGEFEDNQYTIRFTRPQRDEPKVVMITEPERRLLKEEFVSIMYKNFIDGKDTDFDYTSVDNNEDFDNLDIKNNDAEEKYFDSESPEEMPVKMEAENEKMTTDKTDDDESDDELDVFMQRLNQHHSIRELSNNLNNL